MKIKVLLVCVLTIIVSGCVVMPQINYSLPSVPEEGGVKFTKITEIEDDVLYPKIKVTQDSIFYTPVEFFDISKDGMKIAYMGWKNNKSNIYVKYLEGGKGTLQRTFRENVVNVSFSPDGKFLAFSDYRDNNWNIYTVGAESGSAIRQITTSNLHELYPVFSPDGNLILFVQFEKKKIGEQVVSLDYLWTYNLDKSFLTQYGRGSTPAFTPDGKKVVVRRTNTETGYGEIWLIDLEKGQEFIILALKGRSFREKSVSPDGKRIAVVSATFRENIQTNLDIYIVNMDGTGLTQLTFHQGHDLCPRWSPDGKFIYFLSQRGSDKGEYNIWRMDVK